MEVVVIYPLLLVVRKAKVRERGLIKVQVMLKITSLTGQNGTRSRTTRKSASSGTCRRDALKVRIASFLMSARSAGSHIGGGNSMQVADRRSAERAR